MEGEREGKRKGNKERASEDRERVRGRKGEKEG